MFESKIIITKLPSKCTKCPFCQEPWNKNLDRVSAHDRCALGSRINVCAGRFLVLEDIITSQYQSNSVKSTQD
jgi:hypothetical protein